ncbi:hypothetical protein [Pantoea sp. FN0307]|uniref:hypothetical protein n=1 Tax=Pantoea sp. FN0307 TaxID=3418560 RepID=UPI003CF07E90
MLKTLASVRKYYDNENGLSWIVAGVVGLRRLDGQLLQQHLQSVPVLRQQWPAQTGRFAIPSSRADAHVSLLLFRIKNDP